MCVDRIGYIRLCGIADIEIVKGLSQKRSRHIVNAVRLDVMDVVWAVLHEFSG